LEAAIFANLLGLKDFSWSDQNFRGPTRISIAEMFPLRPLTPEEEGIGSSAPPHFGVRSSKTTVGEERGVLVNISPLSKANQQTEPLCWVNYDSRKAKPHWDTPLESGATWKPFHKAEDQGSMVTGSHLIMSPISLSRRIILSVRADLNRDLE
jgi:hypothetical protein